MSYKDSTYVIFDGDHDMWAYGYMKGWRASEHLDFDFNDAHDLDTMTNRARGEEYVKARLRERMKKSSAAIVLIGESTRNLYKFVRWEIDLAKSLDIPLIGVNLNGKRRMNLNTTPPILRDTCAVYTSFKMKIIKFALDHWPSEYAGLSAADRAAGDRYYVDDVYQRLGLRD
tara:strand:+ start:778 stop:1293 length:516 start_codon:yes stop_codon:yes gene_type:complete